MSAASWLGRGILRSVADHKTNAAACRMEETGFARWILDPEHDGVVGLVRDSDDSTALVVVYVDDEDFETSLEFETYAAANGENHEADY